MPRAALALVAVVLLGSSAPRTAPLPSSFAGDRIVLTPCCPRLRLWVDTNGSGFILDRTARRLGLPSHRAAGIFKGQPTVSVRALFTRLRLPVPLGLDARMLVIPRPKSPLFADIDGQVGAAFFQGRRWSIDYRAGTIAQLSQMPRPSGRAVALQFPKTNGRVADGGWYPSIAVSVAGEGIRMSLDTGAAVALNERGIARLGSGPVVRATSFIPNATAVRWHAAHPDWPYVQDAGVEPGVNLIRAAGVSLGGVQLGPVWFSTRSNDDVFSGETVGGKLGGSAFAGRHIVLDYPAARAIFEDDSN